MYYGNEGNVEWFAKNSGFLWEIAMPSFGALILVPEVSNHVSNYVPNFCSRVPHVCFRIWNALFLGFCTDTKCYLFLEPRFF
jgi:hypothetical protein